MQKKIQIPWRSKFVYLLPWSSLFIIFDSINIQFYTFLLNVAQFWAIWGWYFIFYLVLFAEESSEKGKVETEIKMEMEKRNLKKWNNKWTKMVLLVYSLFKYYSLNKDWCQIYIDTKYYQYSKNCVLLLLKSFWVSLNY